MADVGGEDDQPGSPTAAAAASQDWQIVEDGMLSQCGSSPRSLSRKDLDSLEHTSVEPEEAEVMQTDPLSGIEGETGETHFEAEEDAIPTSSHAMAVAHSDAEDRSPDLDGHSDVILSKASEVGSNDVELEAGEESPAGCFSGHSSYADVTLADGQHAPSETVNQELVDSLSASAISEMIAVAEAASDSELESDIDAENIPDTGVFSIATGYPIDTMLFGGQPHPLEARSFAEVGVEPPRSVSSSESSEAMSSTAADSLPQLQPDGREASKWRDWLQSSGNTRASKFLHRMWYQLQVVARRAGTCIPLGLRRRVVSVLKCLDAQASQAGRGSAYLAYGAAFVGFVLALRYYRECKRLRQLNLAQKDAFDMHVLKVLDLNEKLGRGASVPITYNCGFKDLSFGKMGYTHRPVGLPHSLLTAVP